MPGPIATLSSIIPSSPSLSSSLMKTPLKCACDHLQNRCDSQSLDYCLTNVTCFTAVVRNPSEDGGTITMGCMGALEPSRMSCHVGSKESVSILCCNSRNYCNRNLLPQLSSHSPNEVFTSPTLIEPFLHETVYALFGLIFFTLVGAFVLWWCAHSRWRSKGGWSSKKAPTASSSFSGATTTTTTSNNHKTTDDLNIIQLGDSTLKGLFENSFTSGSGSGAPLLAQRTVSRSIDLLEIIGKGRYGQVWRGVYQGEAVAVKIFNSHAEAAWRRECNIYRTVLLRHENVLAFVAADTVSRIHSCTQLWLITRYHKYGSLYDYLNANQISKKEMLQLLASAAAGLVHLHTSIIGTQGKPGIAHRDVKSKNILVMSDKRCCIADLGLAIVETSLETFQETLPQQNHMLYHRGQTLSNQLNEPINLRVGTKRYMSPEVLDGSMDLENFEAFKRSDIYSFGLVMWETARRCLLDGKCDDYELPYSNVVPSDPSFEEMNFVVCISKVRPPPSQRWLTDPTLSSLLRLVEECWCSSAEGRLSMLRIKKSLLKLEEILEKSPTIQII